jgi:hypothetical protein
MHALILRQLDENNLFLLLCQLSCDLVELDCAFYARKVFEVLPRKERTCSLDIWPSITPGPQYFFVHKRKKSVSL